MGKVVIAGGSGFIGHAVVKAFSDAGYDVVVLSRSGKSVPGAKVVRWDAESVGDWSAELEGADAVVNLSGESLLQKWTPKSVERMRSSRVKSAEAVGRAIAAAKTPPKVWINSSATGYYGDTGHREVSEGSSYANDELGLMCRDWEAAVDKERLTSTVRCKLRTGIVLGKNGGALTLWLKLAKLGLGGQLGSGDQYVPWIHLTDLARMFLWLAENPVEGAVNGTAPDPVTNAALMASLRRHVGMPVGLPAPSFAVKMVTSMMNWPEGMLTASARVVPAVANARGFTFEFPDIDSAMKDLVEDAPEVWQPQGLAV